MTIARRRIEDAIDRLIDLLDEIDGDPDFELDVVEEQNDREHDAAEDGIADKAALHFILAERARRSRLRRH